MQPCSPASGITGFPSEEGRFAFRTARISVGERRFELELWDWEPGITVGVMVGILGVFALCWPWGTLALVVMVGLAARARITLVVTRQGAWVENRVFGVVWRRRNVGRHPQVSTGLGWDWEELAVLPSEKALRKGLHDDERVVMAEWCEVNVRKSLDADRLAGVARSEIARLHASDVSPAPSGAASPRAG